MERVGNKKKPVIHPTSAMQAYLSSCRRRKIKPKGKINVSKGKKKKKKIAGGNKIRRDLRDVHRRHI